MQRIILNEKPLTKKAVATIGCFDGIHSGHQQLFAQMISIANKHDYKTVVITFESLPHEYFADKMCKQRLPRLSFLRDKIAILKNLSYIDEVVVLHFNAALANLTPVEFIEKFLKTKLNVAHMVIGYDFQFGKHGQGRAIDLIENGILVDEVKKYEQGRQLVSSTMLRQLAQANQLEVIRAYLGRNLRYTARVIYGKQLGRKYNVPTINLSVGQNQLALHGIYIARVYIDENCYNAVASIGKNPTMSTSTKYHLEAHLLDVNLNLYGKVATVEILEFLRHEQKFSELESLFAQIHLDIANTRAYFQSQL